MQVFLTCIFLSSSASDLNWFPDVSFALLAIKVHYEKILFSVEEIVQNNNFRRIAVDPNEHKLEGRGVGNSIDEMNFGEIGR